MYTPENWTLYYMKPSTKTHFNTNEITPLYYNKTPWKSLMRKGPHKNRTLSREKKQKRIESTLYPWESVEGNKVKIWCRIFIQSLSCSLYVNNCTLTTLVELEWRVWSIDSDRDGSNGGKGFLQLILISTLHINIARVSGTSELLLVVALSIL